jgi:hypothetical protein
MRRSGRWFIVAMLVGCLIFSIAISQERVNPKQVPTKPGPAKPKTVQQPATEAPVRTLAA